MKFFINNSNIDVSSAKIIATLYKFFDITSIREAKSICKKYYQYKLDADEYETFNVYTVDKNIYKKIQSALT